MFISKDVFLKAIDFLVKANLAVAVTLMVAVGVLSITNSEILFEDSEDFAALYGPLASNLQMILVYVAIAEVNILFYCLNREKQPFLLGVGFFYLMMIGGLTIYGEVNQIPIDLNYSLFFLYQAIAHFVFGGYYLFIKIYPVKS